MTAHAARHSSDRARANDLDFDPRDEALARHARRAAVAGRRTLVEAGGVGPQLAVREAVPGRRTRVMDEQPDDTRTDPQTAAARDGVAEPGRPLPHLDTLQRAFGSAHDLSTIEAHVGGAAAAATARMGADAYAFGRHIAFAAWPELRLAAHEAAHVVQQRAGLVHGTGRAGDDHERHADLVAARVVAGLSVAHLFGGGGGSARAALQHQLSGAAPISAVDPDGSIAGPPARSPADLIAAARHDGSATTRLGADDNVFDDEGHVIVAFPATAEGVVQAAMYELHRGSQRSLDDLMRDDSVARTTRDGDAAVERDGTDGGMNDDRVATPTIGSLPRRARGRTPAGTTPVRPIQAYLHAAGLRAAWTEHRGDETIDHAGAPWCGSFATFVYMRCGLLRPGQSLGTALSVPDVVSSLGSHEDPSALYRFSSAADGSKHFHGELATGRFGRHPHAVASGLELDIRPGDVFWNEYPSDHRTPRPHGHVGLIVGVHRTANLVTVVTIEGNSGNRLEGRTRSIAISDRGAITSDIKGWGRPAQLGASPIAERDGAMPAWISEAAAVEAARPPGGSEI